MNKKVIWVGIASALLIGGGIFWWMRTKKKAEKEALEKAEEDAKKKAEQEKGAETTPTTSTTSSDSTGFNQQQGDAFRVWMNKYYPEWRFNGDKLDPTGKPDNSTIRAAYKDYGSVYNSQIKKSQETKSDNKSVENSLIIKTGDRVYARSIGKLLLYEFPSTDSEIAYLYTGTYNQGCGKQGNVNICMDKTIGTVLGIFDGNWTKIRVDVKHYYDKGWGAGWTTTPHDFFVKSFSLIKR